MTTTTTTFILCITTALTCISVGCMTGNNAFEPNGPRTMATSFDDQELFRAVEATVVAQGWTIQRRDPHRGTLEIHEPVVGTDGFVTRQRWLVRVTGGTVSAQMFLDFHEDGRWKKYDIVCDGYDYTQEFAFLETVEQTAHTSVTARTVSSR